MKQKDVLSILKIHRVTLSNYVKEKKIKVKKLHNGRYDYNDEDVWKLQSNNQKRKHIIYQRVSTQKQKKDLENQIKELEQFCLNRGIIVDKIISDIGSGIELDKRKNFLNLIKMISNLEVSTIYITYKDRLTRIQFNTFQELFKLFGTEIVVLHKTNDDGKEYEKELFEELISIIHVFQMKMYSKRRRKKIELIADEQKFISEQENNLTE